MMSLETTTTQIPSETHKAVIRRIPYPFRAAIAICSDLDETPDRLIYFDIMRYLNTTETTVMGPGLGLEVGNTIYFDMDPSQFSYWNTDDTGRVMIQSLIRSGHIDCLHSYGDRATTREHAERALDELFRHGCRLEVWIDHATAPSNFGADIMCGLGDVPDSKAYHADLTCDYGVQFVSRGRVTSVIGQDVPRALHGIWNHRYPLASARTLAIERAKGFLARLGNTKYTMHGSNKVLRETHLRDGQKVFEFIRSNPHWSGVSCGETADGLGDVLSEHMMLHLLERGGVCILYTHLGKIEKLDRLFSPKTKKALSLLAKYSREGKILVTTTRRLLGYCRAVCDVTLSVLSDGNFYRIDVAAECEEKDLDGLTIYVPDPERTRISVNGREIIDFLRNVPDYTGRGSVSLPWRPLEFPCP